MALRYNPLTGTFDLSNSIPASLVAWESKTPPSGVVVGTTDAQSLSNKTLVAPAVSGVMALTRSGSGDALTLTNGTYTAKFGWSALSYEAFTLTIDAVNLNVLTLCNTNTGNAFSAIAFIGADLIEHGAIGVGNNGAGAFANCTYFETSYYPTSGTNAPWPMRFFQTGYLNGSLQTSKRMELASTGDFQLYNFANSVGFVFDPTVNRVGINTVAQPQLPLDVLGCAVIGGPITNRSLNGSFALMLETPQTTTTNGNAAGACLRMVRNDTVKADFQINTSSNRLDIIDTDNSSVVPLSIALTGSGLVTVGSLKTSNPTSGTAAAWKLGSRAAATVAFDTTQYLQVDVAGTAYKVALAA